MVKVKILTEKLKEIDPTKDYHLWADEGGMIGVPSFFLSVNKEESAPPHHEYQCYAKGWFIRTYIDRCLYCWKPLKDYLESFYIRVINK